ncbi:MAG: LysM peptidoglycan-binding domain-containing protein, partial [Planctomycetota bacterium]
NSLIYPDLPCTYVLKEGDTLGGIAKRFYNDSSRWQPILKANPENIRSETQLQIGTTITIPKL